MSGLTWWRCEAEAWPLIVERLPRPLDPEIATMDVRWLHYCGGGLPSLAELAERWGWRSPTGRPSLKRVRLLLAREDWRDPYLDAREEGAGHDEGTTRAREGHARGTRGAREGRAGDVETPAMEPEGARRGHARGTRGAREGHAEGHARVYTDGDQTPDRPDPSPHPLPPAGGGQDPELVEACRELLVELEPSAEELVQLRRPSHQIARYAWTRLRQRGLLPVDTRTRAVGRALAVAALDPLPPRPSPSDESRARPPPTDAQAARLWQELWPQVEACLGRDEAGIWLRHAVPIRALEGRLTLWLPDPELAAYVAEHLLPDLPPELDIELLAPTPQEAA